MPEKCHAVGCDKPAISKGLCDTHRKRLARHGTTEQTRSADWGDRTSHPMYKSWHNLCRYHSADMSSAWREDFWAFTKEVPPLIDEDARAYRPDKKQPWGPSNFYWKVPRVSKEVRGDKAAYMREWQRKARAADPDYGKGIMLRRAYGVDMAWYRAKLEEQKGVCAICEKPETMVIKGRLMALAVDHCHDEGYTRGLLCQACNRGLGFLRHDPAILQKAIDYLCEPV